MASLHIVSLCVTVHYSVSLQILIPCCMLAMQVYAVALYTFIIHGECF